MLDAAQGFINDTIAESEPLRQMTKYKWKAKLPAERGAVFLLDER